VHAKQTMCQQKGFEVLSHKCRLPRMLHGVFVSLTGGSLENVSFDFALAALSCFPDRSLHLFPFGLEDLLMLFWLVTAWHDCGQFVFVCSYNADDGDYLDETVRTKLAERGIPTDSDYDACQIPESVFRRCFSGQMFLARR
jgi:hypothetical protein